MTGQQRAVLWIGLILVGLNLVSQWSKIRSVIFSGSGITSGIGGTSSSGGGLQFPSLPIVGVPLLNQQKTSKATIM
jgi:hypothetical protein